jgi:hypothetical protein
VLTKPLRILLFPGSTRQGSTNVAALRAVVDATDDGATAIPYAQLARPGAGAP